MDHPQVRHIHARLLDIDTVVDVYRILKERYERDLQDPSAVSPQQQGEGEEFYRQRLVREELESAPRVELQTFKPGMLVPTVKAVPIEDVHGLGKYERGEIMVYGAGVSVVFHRDMQPVIAANDRNQDLKQPIADLLAASGPRRIRWKPLLRFGPLTIVAAATAFGAWSLLSEWPPLPVWLFSLTVLAALWVIAIIAVPWLRNRYANAWTGHRFREVRRQDLRDRLTNGRATFYTSLYTVPAGAVIGWLLNTWFGNGS